MSILVVKEVTKIFKGPAGEITALKNVSIEVNKGEIVLVHGPSGSGKTTLILSAGGMLKPDKGNIYIKNNSIYSLSRKERTQIIASDIGFVFQEFHLIPFLSALENVIVSNANGINKNPKDKAILLLKELGLEHRISHLPSELSIGECQRVALARALFHEPSIILADEPTGNLDNENANIVLSKLKNFAESGGAVLLVSHSPSAVDLADRIYSIDKGTIITS